MMANVLTKFSRYPNFLEPFYFARFLRQEFQRGIRTNQFSTIVQVRFQLIDGKEGDISPYSEKISEVIYRNIRQADFWSYHQGTVYIYFAQCFPDNSHTCLERVVNALQKALPEYFIVKSEVVEFYDLRDKIELWQRESRSEVSQNGKDKGLTLYATAIPLDQRLWEFPYDVDYQMMIKRIMDLLFSFFFIIFFLPLSLLIGIAIFIDSPGPVLFRQKRIGLHGKPFYIYKFRTMKLEKSHSKEHQKLVEMILTEGQESRRVKEAYQNYIQSRLTRVGRFLRRTSLDEIPQIINILKGEMSFVGPRPHPDYEVKKYKKWYYQRLLVKPGLTGLSKVCLRFSPENYEEAMRLDVRYVREWSIKLDLKIIFNTLKAIWVDYE